MQVYITARFKNAKENKMLDSENSNPNTLCSNSTINSWKMMMKEPTKFDLKLLEAKNIYKKMNVKDKKIDKNSIKAFHLNNKKVL